MIFFSILFVMMFTLSFSWTFLETPTSSVLSDGAFQYSNVNLFSKNSWIVGMGGFSQIGMVNSSFLEQFQLLKDPFDLSVGMKIGFGGANSAFMALGKEFKSFDVSTAISYVSPSSSESYFTFHVMANAPLSFGDVRLEYKNGAYSNELAAGIAARFSASKEIEWLFKTISIGIGVGWDFNNDKNFFPSKTYFVFQYTR
jgi:hypothetical protein